MKNKHLTRNSLEGRPAWFSAPLLWIAVAVLSFVVAPDFKQSDRLRLALAVLGYLIVQALGIGALLLAPALHSRAMYSRPAQAQASSAPRTAERSDVDLWRDKEAAKSSHKGGFAGGAL